MRERREFWCPLNRVLGIFGLRQNIYVVAVQHKAGNTTKSVNGPHLWLIGLHIGYTPLGNEKCATFVTLWLHFGFPHHNCTTGSQKCATFATLLATLPLPTPQLHFGYTLVHHTNW